MKLKDGITKHMFIRPRFIELNYTVINGVINFKPFLNIFDCGSKLNPVSQNL